jgi:hypothetical protein
MLFLYSCTAAHNLYSKFSYRTNSFLSVYWVFSLHIYQLDHQLSFTRSGVCEGHNKGQQR